MRLENTSLTPHPSSKFHPTVNAVGIYWRRDDWTRGIMGSNLTLSIKQITDGSSQTVMLAEIRAGVNVFDMRGVWAMGIAGASSIWGHAIGDATGPKSCFPYADDIPHKAKVESATSPDDLAQDCMGLGLASGPLQVVPRSRHASGIHVCFADGSGRLISDDIDIGKCGNSASSSLGRGCIGTWHYLTASQDAFAIDASSF